MMKTNYETMWFTPNDIGTEWVSNNKLAVGPIDVCGDIYKDYRNCKVWTYCPKTIAGYPAQHFRDISDFLEQLDAKDAETMKGE